jgi:hypothetical protein
VTTVKQALCDALEDAFNGTAGVVVSYGSPMLSIASDIIAVRDVDTTDVDGDAAEDVTVAVSCYAGGPWEAQRVASERAQAHVAVIEATLAADPTLAGACRLAAVDSSKLDETVAHGFDGLPRGRLAEARLKVRALLGTSEPSPTVAMPDSCTVTRVSRGALNESTGVYAVTTATIYTGRCRLITAATGTLDVAGIATDRSRPTLEVPYSATGAASIAADDRVAITSGPKSGTTYSVYSLDTTEVGPVRSFTVEVAL